ncbi:hypothetical protein EDD11_010092 [Mortierella claussenii]|nr:hypothetical protein EDD11_010092 [Mortierella claussenii]
MTDLSKENWLKLVQKEFQGKSNLKFIRKLIEDTTPKITQTELLSWTKKYLNLEIDQPTISRLLKRKHEFKIVTPSTGKFRRVATAKFPAIEKKVAK